jgi:hypothetical protein
MSKKIVIVIPPATSPILGQFMYGYQGLAALSYKVNEGKRIL